MSTYARDVTHCSVSPYVRLVTVSSIAPAKNSDRLSILLFNEVAYQAVVPTGAYSPGDALYFIPADSVLSTELSALLGVTSYLSKGRVRSSNLRGNRSDGIVATEAQVSPYLSSILKWEDPPSASMGGILLARALIPETFVPFYKMPNLLNEPELFSPGEVVLVSEKLHGTNCRFGRMTSPGGKEALFIGSHNTVHSLESGSVYVETVVRLLKGKGELPLDVVFFGEIFGKRIQHLDYGRVNPELLVFASMKNGEYHLMGETQRICSGCSIPSVAALRTEYLSTDQMLSLSQLPSLVSTGTNHLREGIVIRSESDSSRMAKVINPEYLSKPDRTERH